MKLRPCDQPWPHKKTVHFFGATSVSGFVGFIKREISRRLGQRYKLPGTFWHQRYVATALPTEESQVKCLKYILSQGVKEDLVERPEHWPGLHCAKHLMTGAQIKAQWFHATAYHRAKVNQKQCLYKRRLNKSDFVEDLQLTIDSLPGWSHLREVERRCLVTGFVERIVSQESQRRQRESKRIVGRRAVKSMDISICKRPLLPPWWRERRRQLTAWAKRFHEATRAYVGDYWCFQLAYREASLNLKKSIGADGFPDSGWTPSLYRA